MTGVAMLCCMIQSVADPGIASILQRSNVDDLCNLSVASEYCSLSYNIFILFYLTFNFRSAVTSMAIIQQFSVIAAHAVAYTCQQVHGGDQGYSSEARSLKLRHVGLGY